MKSPKFNIFLIFSGLLIFNLLIFSPQAFGMKQQQKDTKTKSKSIEKEVESKSPERETPKNLSDVPADVFSDILFPFIEKQEEVLKLRSISKDSSGKEGVKLHTERFRPVKLKLIDPNNIKDFLKMLNMQPKDIAGNKQPKGLDFFVSINILGMIENEKIISGSSIKKIIQKDFDEIFNLIGNKIKELTLTNFDFQETNFSLLKKCQIRKLTLFNCTNLTNKFIGTLLPDAKKPPFSESNLPATLEELDFMHCESNITGSAFDSLPKTLKIIKLPSLNKIAEIYLHEIPNTVKTIFVLSASEKTLNNPWHQEKVLILREKGIVVLDGNGKKYPVKTEEIKKYLEATKAKIVESIWY